MVVVAGMDASKATLDVSISEGPVLRFDNRTTGIRNLLRHLERAGVAKALYICAWVVLCMDGDLRDFYRRLRERGKPGKVAVIAVARKPLMQLNAIARRGTP